MPNEPDKVHHIAPAPALEQPAAAAQGLVVEADVKDSSSIAKLDAAQLLLDIVSDKTGYPTEMIDLSMELESELGIDSIKRVEILSALQDQLPNGIDFNANELAARRTLEEIVTYMESSFEKKS